MALTVTKQSSNFVGDQQQFNGTLDFDSSYPTGGEAISLASMGFVRSVDRCWIENKSGYVLEYDYANNKIKVYQRGTVATAALQSISVSVPVASMTDNTDTTGFIDFASSALPSGAIPVASQFAVTAGFSGDTTATWKMGIAGDLDRYSALTTNSCLTAITTSALVKNATAVQGTNAARTPRLTITGAADFTSIKTAAVGAGTATLYYLDPAVSGAALALSEVANTADLSALTGIRFSAQGV